MLLLIKQVGLIKLRPQNDRNKPITMKNILRSIKCFKYSNYRNDFLNEEHPNFPYPFMLMFFKLVSND